MTKLPRVDTVAVTRAAAAPGTCAYVLPEVGIRDRASFFDAVRKTLPLDPPLLGSRSWDALSDSLWGGLDAQDCTRIIMVWPNSRVMEKAAPGDYETALAVLADVAASLRDAKATRGRTKHVSVLIGASA